MQQNRQKTVIFYTQGCKVNQNETAAMEELFRRAGFCIAAQDAAVDADSGDEPDASSPAADVCVVNSCTVTAGSDAKCRKLLRRAKKDNPAAVAVLTGCFPQAFPHADFPEADVVTGTACRANLVENVERFLQTGARVVDIRPAAKEFETLPGGRMQGRTRAFVKIEDGCHRRCAYCIIPTARGPVRSRPEADTLAELSALAADGVAEVVFTGINLPSYGHDTGTCLADIVEAAAQVGGIRRIRLSSLDPDLLEASGAARLVRVEKLCPQFHLSLQSGCTETLRRMGRPYTAARYRAAAESLRAALPHATFTTDVIVGFPGETDEEFAESLCFVKEMRFLKVHVFPYSRRPGTRAAAFPNQVPRAEKERRAALMRAAAEETRAAEIAGQAGREFAVLLETPSEDGLFTGYTETYIPVVLAAPGCRQGDVVAARLGAYNGEAAAAEFVRKL